MRNHDRSLSAAALIVEILFMKIYFPQGLHLAVHVCIEVKKTTCSIAEWNVFIQHVCSKTKKKPKNIPSFYPFIQIKENARGKDKNIDLEVKKSYSVQVPYFCVVCTPPNKYNLFKEFCFPPLKYKYSILSTVLCGIIVCLFVSWDLGDA